MGRNAYLALGVFAGLQCCALRTHGFVLCKSHPLQPLPALMEDYQRYSRCQLVVSMPAADFSAINQ